MRRLHQFRTSRRGFRDKERAMTRQARSTVKSGLMLGALCFAGCGEPGADGGETTSDQALRGAGSVSGPVSFGTINQGACGTVSARLWTLTNANGLIATLTDFG